MAWWDNTTWFKAMKLSQVLYFLPVELDLKTMMICFKIISIIYSFTSVFSLVEKERSFTVPEKGKTSPYIHSCFFKLIEP